MNVDHVHEAVPTLIELKDQGIIKAIGIGCRNFDFHDALFDSGHGDLHLTYLEYNLLSQNALPLIEKAKHQGNGILNATTFYHGLLAGPDPLTIEPQYQVPNDPIKRAHQLWLFAEEKDVSLMHLNFQWILRNPGVTSILLGASTPDHLQADLDALTPIDEEIFLELNDRFGL
jgi:aryl-alcohol dehydrogenase-like predicted oxidoreductase